MRHFATAHERRLGEAQSVVNRDRVEDYFQFGAEALRRWRPSDSAALSPDAAVLDLFCGCGGMSLGFAALGRALGAFSLAGGIDIDPVALSTYEANFRVSTNRADIAEMAADVRQLKRALAGNSTWQAASARVLVGCAPCQGFSAHSKRRWSSAEDSRNSLVASFGRIAAALTPDVIVMENVPELLSGRHWGKFEAFVSAVGEAGYVVKQAIVNAANWGVPQERFRAIVIAMRHPHFSLPTRTRPIGPLATVRGAIGDLPPIAAGAQGADPLHRSARHRPQTVEVLRAVPRDGGSRPKGVGPACLDRTNGFSDVYGRLRWDRPAITITHYARNPASGRFVHPEQDRGLTMREAARLQSFPDGYEFLGGLDDVFRQIGEAVPPLLSVATAAHVLASLRSEVPAPDGIDENLVLAPVSDSYASVIAGLKASKLT